MRGPVPMVASGFMPKSSPTFLSVSSSMMEAPGVERHAKNASNGCSSVMVKVRSSKILKPSSSDAFLAASCFAPRMLSTMSWLHESGCVRSRVNV